MINIFKLKTFLIYILIEPWTTKFSIPNLRTLSWIFIIISLILEKPLWLWISIIFGILIHGIYEYKSGKFIYWYRQRKFRERNEALKKVREKRKFLKATWRRGKEEENLKEKGKENFIN